MAKLLEFPTASIPAHIPDADARERALDITQSWIVEAPAGSGKTGLLIQRFLKLLSSPSVDDPSQVLAITFTRKATGELRDRVLHQLASAAAGIAETSDFDRATRLLALAVLARDAQLAWNLLDNPARLNIRTIDSISHDIASALPVLSGSGGRLTPTEDAQPLYAEAARRTLRQLGAASTPDARRLSDALSLVLLHRDGNLANCEFLIASMLATREQWASLVPLTSAQLDDAHLDRHVLPRLERTLDLIICRGLTGLQRVLPEPLLQTLCRLAAEMGSLDGYKGSDSPIAICAGRHLSPDAGSHHLEHWRALAHLLVKPSKPRTFRASVNANVLGFQIEKHHQAELKSIIASLTGTPGLLDALCHVDTLPPARYPADQWHVTKALFRVLSHALAELQLIFAERGLCDFPEIAILARTALDTGSAIDDLGIAAGTHLQHLLVDEMQDTSAAQYELVHLLTRRWDGHSQTLFLVGDPKQSIYLFRQARVERFVHTMLSGTLGSSLDALSLRALHLTANFRSQRALVHSFNAEFPLIFPPQPDPAQPELVPYRPADAIRPVSLGDPFIWHANPLPYTPAPPDRAVLHRTQARADALEIRRIVEAWRARPLPPGRAESWKIAVLVQARTHLLEVVQAFKQSGPSGPIPYRAVNIEPLAERQEILDLLALTRALLHPADRTAWLALLRTPWCGLSLADLHRLAGQDDSALARATIFELIQSRGELLSANGIARLQPFYLVLSRALDQRGRLPLSQWIARTWRAFQAHAFSSPEALANINRFLALLDELETSTGVIDLRILAERLKKLYAAAALHPGAVDLTTIHSAKGLEWDVVLIPSLQRPAQTGGGRLLAWLDIPAEDAASTSDLAPGLLAPIRSKGGASGQLNDFIRGVETARLAAERKRLFYVACTRAREQLHLFAAPDTKADGTLSIRPDSLLAAAWPSARPHFTTAAPILRMPAPAPPLETFAIAASAAPRLIERIPTAHLPAQSPTPLPSEAPPPDTPLRPEAGFSARVFGNTLHALLEQLAARLSAGSTLSSLRDELRTWPSRITAVLRSSGLAPVEVARLAPAVLRGLTNTLDHPEGAWLLAPHPHAASEQSLISWSSTRSSSESLVDAEDEPQAVHRQSLRLDRTFLAGPTPLITGQTHRWIVDYKTSTHATQGLASFLEDQRETYRPQLEAYARQLSPTPHPIRLALYFPLLPALIWWSPTPTTPLSS